jgi:hypothetical protein
MFKIVSAGSDRRRYADDAAHEIRRRAEMAPVGEDERHRDGRDP